MLRLSIGFECLSLSPVACVQRVCACVVCNAGLQQPHRGDRVEDGVHNGDSNDRHGRQVERAALAAQRGQQLPARARRVARAPREGPPEDARGHRVPPAAHTSAGILTLYSRLVISEPQANSGQFRLISLE